MVSFDTKEQAESYISELVSRVREGLGAIVKVIYGEEHAGRPKEKVTRVEIVT